MDGRWWNVGRARARTLREGRSPPHRSEPDGTLRGAAERARAPSATERLGAVGLAWLLVAGCDPAPLFLTVELRTDWVPGFEFTTVVVAVDDGAPRRVTARENEAFVEGRRVAEYEGLTSGLHTVRVDLHGPSGDLVASRLTSATVRTDLGLVVVITRTCRAGTCPRAGDDPAATECHAGRCVDPSCHLDAPEACGPTACAIDADCLRNADCAEAVCSGGTCLFAAEHSRCPPAERCDPDLGCVPRAPMPDAGPPDAGPLDACAPSLEVCNGIDDDCDPATADGARDPGVGAACDGPDADRCEEGAIACVGGVHTCTDDTGDAADLCNGRDDDCDPSTPDGAAEPTLGRPCDGPDRDLCAEGTVECSGGSLSCSDRTGNSVDLCNGRDDDCDPSTPDGAHEPTLGMPCDGSDADRCLEGMFECSGGSLSCSDHTGDSVESCNGRDDDCDGTIDEGSAGCPCPVRHRSGRAYLMCTSRRAWTDARDYCRSLGYRLVTINDSGENTWVNSQADGISREDWYIGLNDTVTEGVFVWDSGSTASYRAWLPGEPFDSGGQDCVVLRTIAGQWDDVACVPSRAFVCESP